VIFGLEGSAGAEEIVVVVPDPTTDNNHVEPMLVGVERRSRERNSGGRVGRGVLRVDAEDRHL